MLSHKVKFLICFLILASLGMVWGFKIKPKYYLSIGAIFRNEARFLPEWIEYHRLRGVEHFYLFNNLSQDDYQKALAPYIQQGIVDLYEWPYQGHHQKEWNRIQCAAYRKIISEKKRETFWLAIIDTDEFLVPTKALSIPEFLKPYERYGGVALNWQLFGTSSVKYLKPGQSMIATLTHRAPQEHEANLFLKSIVQPAKVKKISEPHYCRYKKPYYHVSEKQEKLPYRSLSSHVSVEKMKVHHYTYRDEAFFKTEKQKRYQEWNPQRPPPQPDPDYDAIEDSCLVLYGRYIESLLSTSSPKEAAQ